MRFDSLLRPQSDSLAWRLHADCSQGFEKGIDMNCDLCTIGALALVLVFGWVLDHRDVWRRAIARRWHQGRPRATARTAAPHS
jgi:hypothetical protein